MPRDNAGNFTLVPGNPVQSGTVVSSTWANSTLDDVSTALTDSLDRYGRGGMLAPFKFSDGTNLLPGAAWVNEPTTGFYRFDAGDLRAAVLTQDVMRWQSTGAQVWSVDDSEWQNVLTSNTIPTVVPDGTAEGQTLRWDNTGSEWEATSDLVVDSSGDVGIGTSSPSSTLEVSAPSGEGITFGVRSTATDWYFGAKQTTTSWGNGNWIKLSQAGNNIGNWIHRSNSGYFSWEGNSAEYMRIDSSGNVGIGTQPVTNRKLTVESDVAGLQALISSTTGEAGIAFKSSGSSNTFGTRLGCKVDALTFTTGGSESVRISSNGNVGIGTTATNTDGLSIGTNADRKNVSMARSVAYTDSETAPAYTWSGDLDTGMFRRSANGIGFTCGGAEVMYLSSSGVARVITDGNQDRIAGTGSEASASTIERFITCSQSEYNALTKEARTLYIIV